ncbi:MAG: flagellar motor protein [Deltaproteobacteria bacterium]|nr:flagellar motor protein [Deltaproteobacteria bacterium]
MDIATIIGLVLGFGAIIGGQILEGGHVQALLQPTAALIVLGGTFGATLVSFPMPAVLKAFKEALRAFLPPKTSFEQTISNIITYAQKARKDGILSLEQDAKMAKDPFLHKGLNLITDGTEPQTFRDTMEIELATFEEQAKTSPEFFEAAGGFAPTIGIIGAVLGLIHVMSNLSDASKLGEGIAVAFVATIYGLITANIICIPISTKLKHQNKELVKDKMIILEGLFSLLAGENPRFIEEKLKAYLHEKGKGSKDDEKKK